MPIIKKSHGTSLGGYLSFCQFQLLGELHPLGNGQVFVLVELGFESFDLGGREGGAWPFLALLSVAARLAVI